MITKDNVERTFIVYCHTNKINSKKYIGITCQDPEVRWGYRGNCYKQSQPYFAAAIKKYGWENFTHEILFEGLTAQEAHVKEIELIAYYHTYIGDPECWGYNLTRGGFGGVKYLTEEERKAAINTSSLEHKRRWLVELRQDTDAYEAYLQKERIRSKKRMQDPVQYRKMLDKNNRIVAKNKQDPVKKEKIQAAKRQVKKDVLCIRNQLKSIYQQNSHLFTEEQRHLIFDFKPDGKNYVCTSKKQLQNILSQIIMEEQ
jgi:group I intron endonuclease